LGYETPSRVRMGRSFIGALPQARKGFLGGYETPSRALQGALPLDPAQGRGPWESRFRPKLKGTEM